jgi:hypothetical protein
LITTAIGLRSDPSSNPHVSGDGMIDLLDLVWLALLIAG